MNRLLPGSGFHINPSVTQADPVESIKNYAYDRDRSLIDQELSFDCISPSILSNSRIRSGARLTLTSITLCSLNSDQLMIASMHYISPGSFSNLMQIPHLKSTRTV